MKKELFKTIVSDILSDYFFSDYKFTRLKNMLLLRNDDGFVCAELDHWRDYEDESCVIRPIYGRHFDILIKWYEKYDVIPLNLQRTSLQIMRYNKGPEEKHEITFKYDFSDYEEKFPQLCSTLKENISDMYDEYATLNDFYNKIVVPEITGEKELPSIGADWCFVYLTLGYLVDRENYPMLKKKVIERIEWMHGYNEPNVADYYDRLDEIISYMENNVKL